LKIYFARTGGLQSAGSDELLYRNAFLRMNCGDARSMPLTIGIQTAANETRFRARRFAIAVNGVRIEYGKTQMLISSGPNRYNLRTASVTFDFLTKVDDGGSIDILAFTPKDGAPSPLRLTMDGFSDAYRKLRRACDGARRRMPV
jgi:hypothetical protein